MISPVSFGSVAASSNASFSDRIRQPQTYIMKEEPNAASSIKSSKGKGKAGKIVGGFAAAAAVVATVLGVLSHKGTFGNMMNGVKEGGIAAKILPVLDQAGSFIADNAINLKDKVVEFVGKHINRAAE